MSVVHSAPGALALGRIAKALAIAKNDPLIALAYCEGNQWRDTPQIISVLKGAVSSMGEGNAAALDVAQAMGRLLLPLVRNNTLVDRLPLRRVPLNIAVPAFTGDASGRLVAAASAIPASKFTLATLTVLPRKMAGLIVVNEELLKLADAAAETSLGNELARAVTAEMDINFADPNLGGSISNGATTINSGGGTIAALDADFRSALTALASSGDQALANAVWCMSSKTAVFLATLRTTNGDLAYEDLGAKGGTLCGLPVLTSGAMVASGSPSESSILLIDPNQVLYGDQGAAEVQVARSASLQFDDAPSDAAANAISLFQTSRIGLRAIRWCGWERVSSNSVVVIDNIQFAA